MPANSHWARWIHASIGKYLKAVATPIPALLEGIDDRDDTFMESSDRVEIRVNGPFTQEQSAGYFRLQVDVNVLVNSMMGGEQKNAYKLDEILGEFHSAMDGAIESNRLIAAMFLALQRPRSRLHHFYYRHRTKVSDVAIGSAQGAMTKLRLNNMHWNSFAREFIRVRVSQTMGMNPFLDASSASHSWQEGPDVSGLHRLPT